MEPLEIQKNNRQLQENEISVFDVPEEYERDIQIATFERKAGLRIHGKEDLTLLQKRFSLKKL